MRDVDAIREFVLAGSAVFTLKSRKTGTHYTYHVKAAKPTPQYPNPAWFVRVLTGPNNTEDYTYIGRLDDRGTFRSVRGGAAAPYVRAFEYLGQRIAMGALPDVLEFYHAGKCGRCNRVLTTPESVSSGIGPECKKKMGG